MPNIYTVAASKGGVGKTTTAIHVAAFLNSLGPALLLDDDSKTRSASDWAKQNPEFPYRVAPGQAAAMLAQQYEYVVIDSAAGPSVEDLRAAAAGSHLLVVPAVPRWLDSGGLAKTIQALREIEAANYRVLLTRVKPHMAKAALQMRAMLADVGVECFAAEVPELEAYAKAAEAGAIVSAAIDRQGQRAWDVYCAVGEELMR